MRLFIRLLRLDLIRALCSGRFIAAVLAILGIQFIATSGFITTSSSALNVLSMIFSANGASMVLIGICPLIPYGMSYASDNEERATTYWLIRAGVRPFITSKIIAAAISGFMTVFLGTMLFILFLNVRMPLYNMSADGSIIGTDGSIYGILLEEGKVSLYIIVYISHKALSAGFFAASAVLTSTFVADKFFVLTAPMLLYFFMIRIETFIFLPEFLRPIYFMEAVYHVNSVSGTILMKLMQVTVFVGIFLILANNQLDRRIKRT